MGSYTSFGFMYEKVPAQGFDEAVSTIFESVFDSVEAVTEAAWMGTKNGKQYKVLVSQYMDKSLGGILFEVPEEEIMRNDYTENHFRALTENVVGILCSLIDVVDFSYAFCDCEAMIECSASEAKNSGDPIYSILVMRSETGEPQIRLGNWDIDGVTPRE